MIFALRTDKPEAELYLYNQDTLVDSKKWYAHRELSMSLLVEIELLLKNQESTLEDINGFIVFHGPGSFTGLRIGITVANTLSYSLGSPVVATRGTDWIKVGLRELSKAEHTNQFVVPQYGQEAHITRPRK